MMFDNYHGMWNYWFFGIILLVVLAIYVANDAIQFGENGLLWALVVLFMPMMGLFIYLIVRSTWNRTPTKTSIPSNIPFQPRPSPPRREVVTRVNSVQIADSDYELGKREGVQFCTSCGSENNTNSSYCNSCGAKIFSRE